MTKTTWKIEPNRITLYPFGLMKVIGIFFAVILIAFFAYLLTIPGQNTAGFITGYLVFFLFIELLCFGIAGNAVVFDNSERRMYRMFFGIVKGRSVSFDEVGGIKLVNNLGSGYNYRAFLKNNRHGKGVVVSSGYSKRNDANALALTNEVFPIINQYLAETLTPAAPVNIPVDSFNYFESEGQTFFIKKNVVFVVFFGLCFVALGIYIYKGSIFNTTENLTKYIAIAGFLLGGIVIIISAFGKIVFDPATKVVRQEWPLGFGAKEFLFSDFEGFQIVRRTTNMTYSGTDVRMHFFGPNGKIRVLQLRTFKNTKKIERFLDETRTIMNM